MKKIEAILRPAQLDLVREALTLAGAQAVTVTEVAGSTAAPGSPEIYRGSEHEVDFVPRVKLEAAVRDEVASAVIDLVTQVAWTGRSGDGKVFVADLVEAVRVRTGERGDVAL